MENDTLITAPQLRTRYGNISDMTLFRWERDPRMNFPKPVRINKRKYFSLAQVIEWEKNRAGKVVTEKVV